MQSKSRDRYIENILNILEMDLYCCFNYEPLSLYLVNLAVFCYVTNLSILSSGINAINIEAQNNIVIIYKIPISIVKFTQYSRLEISNVP